MSMQYPAFFDEVEPIVLYDPLAEFLGAATAGRVEYTYLDAVKLAGHSCPTVAGAGRAHPHRGARQSRAGRSDIR